MGREIRKVPPKWEHPKKEDSETYQPMLETTYEVAMEKWIKNHNLWLKGKHPDQIKEKPGQYYKPSDHKYFAQWDGDPPDVEYFNTYYTEKEATWYQAYETVSEGTPVSPPFKTKEELAQYLAENGDFWYQEDQKCGGSFRSKPSLEQARSFVDSGHAFSFVAVKSENAVIVADAYGQQDLLKS